MGKIGDLRFLETLRVTCLERYTHTGRFGVNLRAFRDFPHMYSITQSAPKKNPECREHGQVIVSPTTEKQTVFSAPSG